MVRKTGTSPKLGFTFGIGTNTLKLNELNQHLADLQIGKLDPELAAVTLSLHGVFSQGFAASLDANLSSTGGRKRNTYLNLVTSSVGGTLYRSLLKTNRLDILFALAYRMTNMQLEYNANTAASSNFNALFSPAGNATFRIASQINDCASTGVRFQYRLGKRDPAGPGEGRVGFDTGYNYCFRANPWRETGGGSIVANMPTVKPDHFYFLLTLSALFNR